MWKFGHVDKIDKVLLLSLSNLKICIVCAVQRILKQNCALTKQSQLKFYMKRQHHYLKINAEYILRTPGTWDTVSVLK